VRQHYTRRQFEDRPLIAYDDAVGELSPMGACRYYLDGNLFPDRALRDWRSFVMEMPVATGKHTHQGGLVIYILEGSGHSVIDGVEERWEAGDLLLLPVRAGGVEHQFFNDRPGEPCRWLSAIHIPMFNQLGSEFTQQDYAAEFGSGSDQPEGWVPPRLRDEPQQAVEAPDGAGAAGALPQVAVFANGPERKQALADENLFDALLRLRDTQRSGWRGRGLSVVSSRHLPWEENGFARMKWFMHPLIFDTCIRTHIVYEVCVRPGERTGLLRHQGNSFCYAVAGSGKTSIDGVDWEWSAGDMIQLPARPPGIALRHSVADDAAGEARLICFELNTVDQVGLDRGCGFDLLEPATYR
jgi:quercetin dioxygenase-like cupin family protein